MTTKDIPKEFQAHCAVAGDLLDTRVAEEKGLVAEYEGEKYYFCCQACKPTFLANPAKYTSGEQEVISLEFTDKEHVTDNIWGFHFTPSTVVSWQAGQYMRVEIPHDSPDERGTKRWFTVSSAPFEQQITIVTRISESSFKQALANLHAGDTINMIDLPGGDFVWTKGDNIPRVFAIGGIGITPLYSIVKQRQHDGLSLNATLLYANRTEAIPYRDYFDSLAPLGLKVKYLVGRKLTTKDILAESTTDDTIFYLSGAKPMVRQLANNLTQEDVADDHIISDEFPHYDETNY
ncbi:MAG TPA: YHS domain-containing protein [Candidatus Saccharibacteria bacterium]|nr:YHS domain-containing protein [Candidatus Saccharibacteria bacterium]